MKTKHLHAIKLITVKSNITPCRTDTKTKLMVYDSHYYVMNQKGI